MISKEIYIQDLHLSFPPLFSKLNVYGGAKNGSVRKPGTHISFYWPKVLINMINDYDILFQHF